MNAEYLTALAVLIGIAISFRTTSHTELRSLYDALRGDFDRYQTEARKREKEADDKINDLERKVIKYERYINRLISQLEHNSIVPEPMDKE